MTTDVRIKILTELDPRGAKAAEQALNGVSGAATKAGKATADAAQKSAQANAKAATEAIKAERDILRLAQAQARLAAASGNTAGSVQILSTALTRVDRASLAAVGAQTQLQRAMNATDKSARSAASGAAVLPRTLESFGSQAVGQLASVAAGFVSVQAAIGGAAAVGQSFVDAFNFKAELDATTQSINIQLNGIRDTGQVWSEAAAYAETYKLTQQETTNAVQASVGILRTSNASIEETFGVLQRLTVLAPGKSIEDAAFSVRELASGDITSIAEQFNISRQQAYAMRDAIQGGADVVTVLSGFLDNAGVSMDTLKIRTEGAIGAQKDLAIAAEELKLAQAELAQGPGLQVLGVQIEATRGATRLLTGDFEAMGTSLAQSIANGEPLALAFAQAMGMSGAAAQAAAQQYLEHNAAVDAGTSGGAQWGEVLWANGAAQAAMEGATRNATSAITEEQTAIGAQLVASQAADEKTRMLAEAQAMIANLGSAVASGLITSTNAAATLASQYGITAQQAEILIAAQARIAGGQARLAGQRSNTKTLATPGYNAPGRSGKSDADILATVTKTTTELAKIEEKSQQTRTAATRAGGGARVSATKTTADQLVAIEQAAAEKIAAITERMLEQQAQAARQLAADIATSTADMIADQEANDLDLIGAKEQNMDKLRAREEAEGNARIAQAAAVSEAQARAAAGDAETASAILDIREETIGKQQQLDEEYANRRAELAGNPEELAALKQQYDEATAAYAEAAATRVALAEAEAEQRRVKADEEKNAAIAAAAEAGMALAATGKNADSARGQVDAMIARLADIPTNVTTTITVKTNTSGGSSDTSTASSGDGAKMAGGGTLTGVTNGPMTVTLGDNPGGKEAYAIRAVPLSGKGRSTATSGSLRLAGGTVGDAAAEAQRQIDAANARAANLAGQTPRAVASGGGRSSGGGGGSAAASTNDTISAIDKAISVLDKIADLRDKLSDVGPPINMALVNQLADEAFAAAQIMGSRWVKITEAQEKDFGLFADIISNALSVLSDAAALRKDVTDIGPPLNLATILDLAIASEQALFAIRQVLRPVSERQATEIERYVDASSASIGLIADASKLSAKAFSDYQPPSLAQIEQFASDADMVVGAIARAARIYDTEGLEATKNYSEALGNTFSGLLDGLKFVEAINTGDYRVDERKLANFRDDSAMVLDTARAIGARAATIPAADLTALQTSASVLSSYAESLINIAAVPDIQGMAGYMGGGGSNTSMGGVTVNIQAAPGMDINALANVVIQRLNSQVGARR